MTSWGGSEEINGTEGGGAPLIVESFVCLFICLLCASFSSAFHYFLHCGDLYFLLNRTKTESWKKRLTSYDRHNRRSLPCCIITRIYSSGDVYIKAKSLTPLGFPFIVQNKPASYARPTNVTRETRQSGIHTVASIPLLTLIYFKLPHYSQIIVFATSLCDWECVCVDVNVSSLSITSPILKVIIDSDYYEIYCAL